MRDIEKRELRQRNEKGKIVCKIGFAGGTDELADDVAESKKPKNNAEGQLYEIMTARGWTVTKRGWPDFFCVKGNKVCAIEVKPHKHHPLRRNQLAVMGALSAYGISCYKWSPDGGFETIHGVTK